MQPHFRNGTAPCRRTDHADADLKRLSPASAFCFIFCGNFRKGSHRRDRRFRCFCSSRVRSESLKRGSRRSGSQPDSVSWFLFSFKQNVFRTAFRPKEVCADSVIQFVFNSYSIHIQFISETRKHHPKLPFRNSGGPEPICSAPLFEMISKTEF